MENKRFYLKVKENATNRNKLVNNADAALTQRGFPLPSVGKFLTIFPRSDKLKCTTKCAGQAGQAEKFAQIKFAVFLDGKENEVPSAVPGAFKLDHLS